MVSKGKVEQMNLIYCHFIVRLRQFEQHYSHDSVQICLETEDLTLKV